MPKSSTLVVAAAAAAAEPHMRLNLNNHDQLWDMMSRVGYTPIQTILEIMDNAIAEPVGAKNVNFEVDFDVGLGHIEDDGRGFPIDVAGLSRCLILGAKAPTDLNEHGCGLKQALATLDPTNSCWRIVFKVAGIIYEIRAPYTGNIEVNVITVWPGKLTRDSGSYIEFPIKKMDFAELYATKRSKCENPLPLMRVELSQAWMLNERVKSGAIHIHLNSEPIQPLQLNMISDYEKSSRRHNLALSTGARADIYQYELKEAVPNSWFKNNATSSGYYFFKNGRFIESICDGARFVLLMGQETKRHCTGFICIINIVGTQDSLPHTTPTKIHFPLSTLRTELYDMISKNVRIAKSSDESEESLVRGFIQMRKDNFSEFPGFNILEKETICGMADGHDKPVQIQADIIEERTDKVLIYEAKKDNEIRLPAVRQLYGNWKVACTAFDGRRILPVLMIDTPRLELPDWLPAAIGIWEMPIVVMNYGGRVLFGTP